MMEFVAAQLAKDKESSLLAFCIAYFRLQTSISENIVELYNIQIPVDSVLNLKIKSCFKNNKNQGIIYVYKNIFNQKVRYITENYSSRGQIVFYLIILLLLQS